MAQSLALLVLVVCTVAVPLALVRASVDDTHAFPPSPDMARPDLPPEPAWRPGEVVAAVAPHGPPVATQALVQGPVPRLDGVAEAPLPRDHAAVHELPPDLRALRLAARRRGGGA